jgi:putative ABC transport system permease protein
MAWRPSAVSFYRLLLLGYPAEFRHEYGVELERVFEERLAAEPPARVWRDAVLDLFVSAPREHLHVLAADVRYGARVLGRSPSFAAVAVLTMALGIGASTAVFSLLNAVLLRSLPYADPAHLVYIWTPLPRLPDLPRELGPDFPDYFDWTRLSHSFSSIGLVDAGFVNVDGIGGAQRVGAAKITSSTLGTLGVQPVLGRAFSAADEQPGAPRVALISDALWRAKFGGDSSVLGRTLHLDRKDYTIVGVMPPAFSYPHANDVAFPDSQQERTDIWTPLALTATQKTDRSANGGGIAVARLKPGVEIRQAQSEMAAVEGQLDKLHTDVRGWTAYVQPLLDSLFRSTRRLLYLLMGAVLAVLAITCANIAGLLLARGAGRAHELGIRTAIGADRARLVRQMLTEALLLAGAGGVCGLATGWAATRLLVRLAPASIPRIDEVSVDPHVLLFAAAASLVTGLAFGLLPAFAASRVNVTTILALGGGRTATGASHRLRDVLVAAEIALAVTLLAGAGLLLRSFQKVSATDIGFARSTLTANISLGRRMRSPNSGSPSTGAWPRPPVRCRGSVPPASATICR